LEDALDYLDDYYDKEDAIDEWVNLINNSIQSEREYQNRIAIED
jgi:hypothetical protein